MPTCSSTNTNSIQHPHFIPPTSTLSLCVFSVHPSSSSFAFCLYFLPINSLCPPFLRQPSGLCISLHPHSVRSPFQPLSSLSLLLCVCFFSFFLFLSPFALSCVFVCLAGSSSRDGKWRKQCTYNSYKITLIDQIRWPLSVSVFCAWLFLSASFAVAGTINWFVQGSRHFAHPSAFTCHLQLQPKIMARSRKKKKKTFPNVWWCPADVVWNQKLLPECLMLVPIPASHCDVSLPPCFAPCARCCTGAAKSMCLSRLA